VINDAKARNADTTDQIVNIFTDEQEGFIKEEGKHPIIWVFIYALFIIWVTRFNLSNFLHFRLAQESLARLLIQFNASFDSRE